MPLKPESEGLKRALAQQVPMHAPDWRQRRGAVSEPTTGGLELLTPREIADGLAEIREEGKRELESLSGHVAVEDSDPIVYSTAEKIQEFERLRSAKPKVDKGLEGEKIRMRTRHPQDAANW